MNTKDIRAGVDRLMVRVVHELDRVRQRYFFRGGQWPVVSGRYHVGDKDSPVAVCTLSSVDMMREIGPREGIAIIGKTFTENLGIEKMIQNVVTNPAIRFLILCGKESPHRVGQSVQALVANGIDGGGLIVGSKGRMPKLTNVSLEEIDRFRQQIDVIDLIGEREIDTILDRVRETAKRNPGPFKGAVVAGAWAAARDLETVECWHRESVDYGADPAGFFVIQVDSDASRIVVEHYSTELKLLRRLRGDKALSIYSTIIRNDWVSVLGHAAYLGRELYKAELALRRGWTYEQNKELTEN